LKPKIVALVFDDVDNYDDDDDDDGVKPGCLFTTSQFHSLDIPTKS
jgi:hypothetical protein